MNIAILVSGGGTNLQAIIDAVENGTLHDVKICKVIASNRNAYAIQRAEKHDISVSVISRKDFLEMDAYDNAMLLALQESKTELVVAAGFLSMIGIRVLTAFPNRVINVHPALIPAFCGKGMYGIKPHEAALKKGVKISGATVHFLNEHYDEGPIILQKAIDILQNDTPESLQLRIMKECEQVILPQAIQLIADRRVTVIDGRVELRTH